MSNAIRNSWSRSGNALEAKLSGNLEEL